MISTLHNTASHRARTGPRPSSAGATAVVALASIGIGSVALFVRPLSEAGIAPAAVAFFRYAITAIVLLGALDRRRERRSATVWGLAAGAAAGLGWITYADSVSSADLATTGVAYMTYPVFALTSCRLLFGRRPSVRSALGGLLVVLAAAIALGPTALLDASPVLFVAPATFGFSISVLTERLRVLDPSARLASVTLGAALVLAPLVLALPRAAVVPSGASGWMLMLGVALGCGLVPMWIYGAAAPMIGSARTAVAGAVELPTMFAIGAFAYHEAVEVNHVIAAAIIAGSVALTPTD